MEKVREDSGFTITEVIISIIVMSLFLMLFFQLFFVSESQRLNVTKLAEANDVAKSNLNKITAKSQIPAIAPSASCNNTASGAANPNNGVLNTTLHENEGSIVITEPDGNSATPEWSTTANTSIPMKESLSSTSLPSQTRQTIKVSYPRGCMSLMPAKIISIVEYDSETVIHAAYVN